MLKNCFNLHISTTSIFNTTLINSRKLSVSSPQTAFSYDFPEKLPESAKIVICGGGALGASVAYSLAEQGCGADTIVLEQGR